MTYVAFLRAVNVGGKGLISMADIKEVLAALGLSDVRTYINSGNVIFSTRRSDAQQLAGRIEKALEEQAGRVIRLLVMDHRSLRKIDDGAILDRLPSKPGIDELMYTPGAVFWRVDRENVGQSHMSRMVGTPLYKKVTIRSANTVRKLTELASTPPRQRRRTLGERA
ncbi:MAG TPA: DUF1697 domain-containing protein [Candidatus Dormibacteraeota bacterium]|nr:DUF1697 domain-containing protein [Candidatus Dormibacteraeota bacterium]